MILSFFLNKRCSHVAVIVQMKDLMGSFTNLSAVLPDLVPLLSWFLLDSPESALNEYK